MDFITWKSNPCEGCIRKYLNVLVIYVKNSKIDIGLDEAQKVFSFLRNEVNESIHLVRWDSLARSKKLGGWGIKNIFYFGKALTAKSLWRSLFSDNLWSKVIIEK